MTDHALAVIHVLARYLETAPEADRPALQQAIRCVEIESEGIVPSREDVQAMKAEYLALQRERCEQWPRDAELVSPLSGIKNRVKERR